MMSVVEHYLTEDHARLDALLRASIADEQAFDHAAFEEFRAGLLRHIGIEEKLLLPHARRQNGEPLAVAAALRLEHAALASLLVPTPDHALAREIRSLLQQHNLKEEGDQGLYAQCAALGNDDLLEHMKATRPPPLAKHFDGNGTYRSAADALAAAERALQRQRR
jgi:hypothetical protein